MRFACVLVLGSVLIVAATAAAQEGGLTFGVVDVSEVTGGLGVRRARAAVVPHERALWRCAGAHEGSRIALVIAPSGRVRSASVAAGLDVRARACLRRVTRSIGFPTGRRPSTLTLVLRRVYSV